MGLDMYLMRHKKADNVAYWRKANCIRQWLINHGCIEDDDDCKNRYLEKEILEQLVKDCEIVLSDHSKAEDVLPTQSGFFFGSTEYDEYYFEKLEYTIKQVKKIIEETDWENEEVYYYDCW